MKNKIMLSGFILILAIAMIAGATLAWFTSDDDTGETVFTAGTVSIEAGNSAILSQYFDPDKAVYVYGVEEDTGDLYEIDVLNKTVHMIFDTPLERDDLIPSDDFSPNGLAFDKANRRLYFAIRKAGGSELWFYDFIDKELKYAGSLYRKTIYGASFWDGFYWYINNGGDDLYKVSFDPATGKIDEDIFVDDIASNKVSFNLGDLAIAIRDGIIYGSSAPSGQRKSFFIYDINSKEDAIFSDDPDSLALQLQIAFGSDGLLYGHSTKTGKWYILDSVDGSSYSEFVVAEGRKFNDLAPGYVSVWNPGDCERIKYFVKNTGTKDVFLRVKLEGWWTDESLSGEVVKISLCGDNGWEYNESDGYFYYKNKELKPEETIELCVRVCLDGPGTGNEYKGQTYVLSGTVYAIQASNGAIDDEWLNPSSD